MSEFDDLISSGFAEMLEQLGVPITCSQQTAKCIPGNARIERELRETGLWQAGMVVIEMQRTDQTRLGIADRVHVEFDGAMRKVLAIESDAADPCVRITLHPSHRPEHRQ